MPELIPLSKVPQCPLTPVEEFQAAERDAEAAAGAMSDAREHRVNAIVRLLLNGYSYREAGGLLGLTAGRISQLVGKELRELIDDEKDAYRALEIETQRNPPRQLELDLALRRHHDAVRFRAGLQSQQTQRMRAIERALQETRS